VVATNAEEFLIRLNSNLQPVASRDEAALRSLDAQIRAVQRNMGALDAKAAQAAAAAAQQAQRVEAAAAAMREAPADMAAIRSARARLEREQAAMEKARERQRVAQDAANVERASLGMLQGARPKLEAAANAAKKAADAKKAAAAAGKDLSGTISALGGPLSSLAGRFSGLAPLVEMGATAVVALGTAALAIALVAGAAAAVVALTRFGLAAVEARRQSMGLGEALSGVSRRPAQEFVAVVDQLAGQVPLARDKIQGLTQEIALLRLGGRDMQAGVVATAFATSALGDAAGGAVKGIIQQSAAMRRFTLGARDMWGEFQGLAGTGLTKADVVGALAKQMGKSAPEVEKALILGRVKLKDGLRALEEAARSRFGKTVAGKMLDVTIVLDKAKERLDLMFRDINTSKLVAGLGEFASLLDESTVSGKAFRFLFTTGTQAIADVLGGAARAGGKFFQGMAIGALRAYIAIKPTYNSIRDFIGMQETPGWLTAVNVGKAAFYALAGAVGVVAVSLALAAVPFVIIGTAIYGLASAASFTIGIIGAAIDYVSSGIDRGVAAFRAIDWGGLGRFAIDGLVGAFRSGAAYVAQAVTDLAMGAAGAFKRALGIASPSKLFGKFADWTVQGYVQQIEAGQPEAAAATAVLGSGQPSVSVGGPTVNVATRDGAGEARTVQIIVQGTGDPEAVADRVLAKLFGLGFVVPQEAS
jgi:hypothetical protein